MGACCYSGGARDDSRGQNKRQRTHGHQSQHPPRHSRSNGATTSSPQPKVNINSARVHQLCTLEGIDRHLAEEIVNYRSSQGPFASVQDLLNVPGVDSKLLRRLQKSVICNKGQTHELDERGKGAAPASINSDVGKKQEGNIRIGSWNLKCFSAEKASNDGYREVLCMVILENGLDLVAFQELADSEALEKICKELNNPTLRAVKSWQGKRGHWKCTVSEPTGRMYKSLEYNGFLWKENVGITMVHSGLFQTVKLVRWPYIGEFKIGNWACTLVSVHLKATGLEEEYLEQLNEEIRSLVPIMQELCNSVQSKSIILLGDFNAGPDNRFFKDLSKRVGFKHLLPCDVNTNISSRNLKGSKAYDNIWINDKVKYTGRYGVVRSHLQHGLIIDDRFGGNRGTLSDHCPVWAEFYS
eukprot:Em0018g74a